jgi:hypothetical protein
MSGNRAALALHQAIRQIRNRHPDRPSMWAAAYTHVGVNVESAKRALCKAVITHSMAASPAVMVTSSDHQATTAYCQHDAQHAATRYNPASTSRPITGRQHQVTAVCDRLGASRLLTALVPRRPPLSPPRSEASACGGTAEAPGLATLGECGETVQHRCGRVDDHLHYRTSMSATCRPHPRPDISSAVIRR